MDASIKALHKNIMEWLAGPTGSIVLHCALILALILLVDMTTREREPEIEVIVMELPEQILDVVPEDRIPPEDVPDLLATVTPPDVNMDQPLPPDFEDFASAAIVESITLLDGVEAISPLVFKHLSPGNMVNRNAEGRQASLAAYGGPWAEYAEAAVLRALAWLVAHQNPDGSWGTHDREAYTGLAILTFLAHGETTDSEQYGETVSRAIRYLVARQNERGEFARTQGAGGVYAHTLATYAISEAYGMTRILALKSVMEKAIQVLLDGQHRHGGWVMYTFAKDGDSTRWDVSLTGFVIQALKAAYIAGAQNPGLSEALDQAADFLVARQLDEGRFPYSAANQGRQPNMTAVGVLGLQLLGYADHAATRAGQRFLRTADASWQRPEQAALYSWYYVTQAKFHQGGGTWSSWNSKFAPALIRNQNPDGSWHSPSLALQGDGVTREFRGEGINTQLYATTFAALTLQVYYRFLPTFQPIQERVIDHRSSDDIQIQIL